MKGWEEKQGICNGVVDRERENDIMERYPGNRIRIEAR